MLAVGCKAEAVSSSTRTSPVSVIQLQPRVLDIVDCAMDWMTHFEFWEIQKPFRQQTYRRRHRRR